MTLIPVDDQPISANFFGDGRWLSNWVTPEALEVGRLYDQVTHGLANVDDRVYACWEWVANTKYKSFICAHINVEGVTSKQEDYWQDPTMMIHTKVGNCANKAFLLTSLLRKEFEAGDCFCVLGNLYNGKPGGHAWTQIRLNGEVYVVESTRPDLQPLVKASIAVRYEPVHFFNDKLAFVETDKTALEPFARCYSTWLVGYLDWAYIEGRKE